MRRRGSGALRRALSRINANDIALCSVVVAELLAGCYGAQHPPGELAKVAYLRRMFHSLPLDDNSAEVAARIQGELSARGLRIGSNDLFVAAIAVANDLTLVTHNISEFGRVAGLRIEDWQATP